MIYLLTSEMLLKDAPITILHLTHYASQNQVNILFSPKLSFSVNKTAALSRAGNMIAYKFGMQANIRAAIMTATDEPTLEVSS